MRSFLLLFSMSLLFVFASCKDSEKEQKKSKDKETVLQKNEQKDNSKVILFFGNSLTAGYGLETDESFPALIQQKLDSLNLDYKVVNAGLSGETTASGKNRLEWILNQNVDIFVLELGANDGLRGIPLNETRKNLQEIIDTVREKNPETKIVLAGMQIPPNMGQDYTSQFKNIFPELAEENDVFLIPFLLEDVAGIPELNQQDGIHPTIKGQKIVSENVWKVLKPLVKKE